MAERSKYENLELTSDQIMELAGPLTALVQSDGWRAYRELLKGRRIQYREILSKGSKDAFDRVVGLVAGLEEAEELPEMILRLAGVIHQREEAEAARPTRRHFADVGDDGGPSFS